MFGSVFELTPPPSPKDCEPFSTRPVSTKEASSSTAPRALTVPPEYRIPKKASHLSKLTGNNIKKLPVKQTLKLEKERIRKEKARKKTSKLHCKYCDIAG